VSGKVTALAAALLCLVGGRLAAQAAPPDSLPRFRLRLPYDSLVPSPMPSLRPGGRIGARTTPSVVGARWEAAVRAAIVAARAARRQPGLAPPEPAAADSTPAFVEPPPGFPPPGVEPPVADAPSGLDAISQYADIGLQLRARFEMKVDQLRNQRCTAADAVNPLSGCQGGFPTPALDQQFNVRAGGVIGDRFHMNVDFDSEREFSANNNIHVYYEGLEDEILQRVEVGNVSFAAPPSRFITANIPANSFGVQAEAQVGAFAFRSILAQQKGSQLRSRVYSVGDQTTQPVDLEIRDLDFEAGRFFFVVNPRSLPGFPDADILTLGDVALSPTIRPVEVRVYRLRAQTTSGANPNLGGIDAIALRPDGPQRVGPFPWELLEEGRDYFIDPTGSWFALSNRVGEQDFLAVSYITAAGDTIGTFPAVNGRIDTLELIYEPRRGPEVATFDYEMRNVYRVGANDIQRETMAVSLVVNESEQPLGGQSTYLSLLGLAEQNDPSAIDQFNRVFPRTRDPSGGAPIRDLFLIFPHLRPFADATRLSPGERNDSLYRTPTYLLNTQGPPPRFRMRMHFEALGAGDRATLSLGALGVREGSEKLFIGNTELRRGGEYEIDYTIGLVTFLNPDSLFRGATQVRAQFEENEFFDIAPTSIMGLSTTYDLGARGQINAIGMLQRESSLLTRPQLGFEPNSNFVGGLSTQLTFRPDVLTDMLDALPLVSTSVPSRLTLDGEIAFSRPNPNQAGEAFIEEFEGAAFRPVALVERAFQLGSRPESGLGLPATHLGSTGGFDDADAVPMVWQNAIQVGNEVLRFEPRDIDSTIRLTGAAIEFETVLWLTMKPDTVGGVPDPVSGTPRWFRPHSPGPRWRSLSQPLGGSGIGIDLSRTEFLEFWVLEDADRSARQQGATLVLDFGTVFEDAVAFGPDTLRATGGDTVFTGFQFLGRGRLDTERDTLTNVFNAAVHDVGIHGDLLPSIVDAATGETISDLPTCLLTPGAGLPVFPQGDLGARCTRRNGSPDSEDLNGDGRLDVTVGAAREDVFRYVFPIGDDRFFVRSGVSLADSRGRAVVWRLYRIPFREDTIQIGTPNIRQIESLRLTVVAPDRGSQEAEFFVALARMRLVGAPWLKRAASPIAGLGGSRGESHGEVVASVVTTENQDLGYTPPPGVIDQADRLGAGFDFASQQINEKSLRLLASDLRTDERAEAFRRFTDEADKNFLRYRELRLWARGRGPGWEDGDLEFFVKVGRDEHNFYMYQTPIRSFDWEPEVVVDIERWLILRAKIESAWLRGEPPSGSVECGGDPEAFVACDGRYIVQVRDPAVSPPNLARVSEVAVGMRRVAERVFIAQAELWVDDIRLGDVVDDMGVAGAIDAQLQAGDVFNANFGYSTKDDRFQQLGEDPSYVTDGLIQLGGTIRLEKFVPGATGKFSLPLSIQRTRSTADPFYLNRSDIRADGIRDLRQSRTASTSYALSYRRLSRGSSLAEKLFVDPFAVTGSLQSGQSTTQLSDAEVSNKQLRVDYINVPADVSVKASPGFLDGIVGGLPPFISRSLFAKSLRTSRLRLTPFAVRGGLQFNDSRSSRFAYRVPVTLASDSAILPLESLNRTLRSSAGIDVRPFRSLSYRIDVSSTRNLRDYGDTTTVGRLLGRERRSFLGQDVGFEQLRLMTMSFNVAPVVSSWMQPRFQFASSYSFNRDPNARQPVRVESDSAGGFRSSETLGNTQRREIGATVNPPNLIAGVTGDSSVVTRLFRRLLPIDGALTRDLRSSFNRPPFDANLHYQLGLGGFDDFLEVNGVPATSAAESHARRLTSGVRLPLNVTLRGSYEDRETSTWSRRGLSDEQSQVVQRSREWPSGSLSWTHTPRWFIKRAISLMSVNARVNRTKTESVQPGLVAGTSGTGTANITRSFAPSVSVTWVGGITSRLQHTSTRSDAVTSGNVTQRDQSEWGATLNFSFLPPRALVRLPNDIRSTVSYNTSTVTVCLLLVDADECTSISDSRRSSFDVRMDTGFSTQVRSGLSFSLIHNEQRHTSTETRQVVFTIFAEVLLVSGQIR